MRPKIAPITAPKRKAQRINANEARIGSNQLRSANSQPISSPAELDAAARPRRAPPADQRRYADLGPAEFGPTVAARRTGMLSSAR